MFGHRLADRVGRLEVQFGGPDRGPHQHPCRLYVLGGDGSRPPDDWLAARRQCDGCARPDGLRPVIWPPAAGERLTHMGRPDATPLR